MDYVLKRFRPLRKRAYERIVRECEEELARTPQQVGFSDRVRWHIRGHFRPNLDLNTVARELRMTPRSLSRRLAMEDTSFRRLLHEVRMEIASHSCAIPSSKWKTLLPWPAFPVAPACGGRLNSGPASRLARCGKCRNKERS